MFLVLGIILSSSKSLAQTTEFDTEKFVELASLKFFAEIETAKAALQQSASPAVRAYAKIMIDENSNNLSELRTFAIQHHIALPNDVELYSKAHKYIFARKGQSFDVAYTNMRAVERRKMVNLYRSAIKSDDAAIKLYAETRLPTLMRHLYMSQELVQNIGSSPAHVAKL
jgi:putative membrane protein